MNKKSLDYESGTITLAKYAKALGHPTRIKIIKYIEKHSSRQISDLIQEIPLAQSTISQHIKELKDAGLLEYSKKSSKIFYSLNVSNWQSAKAMFNNLFR